MSTTRNAEQRKLRGQSTTPYGPKSNKPSPKSSTKDTPTTSSKPRRALVQNKLHIKHADPGALVRLEGTLDLGVVLAQHLVVVVQVHQDGAQLLVGEELAHAFARAVAEGVQVVAEL